MRLPVTVPAAASTVLLALLGLQLVAGWRAVRQRGEPPPRSEPTALGVPAQASVAAIIRGHLFGAAPAMAQVDPSVRLALSGTLAGADPRQGFAIIASAGAAAQFYATGAALPGGAVLTEVYDTRALIDRGGMVEELRLPRDRNPLAVLAAASEDGMAGTAAVARNAEPVGGADVQRSILSVLPGNLDAVRVLRPKAVIGDGRVLGYEISPIHPERLGIRAGDQLVAVNGTQFKDPDQAAMVFEKLSQMSGGTVDLTMVHAGDTYRVTVDASVLRRRPR